MTQTQQAIADLQAEGEAVWDRASMAEMSSWALRLADAQVAAWRCGECCGNRSSDGSECLAMRVRIERAAKLREGGAGRASVRAMAAICEHSEQYADIQAAYRLAKDMAPDGVRLADVVNAVQAVERDLDGNGNDGSGGRGLGGAEHGRVGVSAG